MSMKKNNLETHLDQKAASLTTAQKNELWERIKTETVTASPIPSPYQLNFNFKKPMAPIIAAIVLMLGVGGTAVASESARPGDLLFPIDQAIEDVRLALATSDEAEARLKITFAEERLAELRSLLEEDNSSNSSDDYNANEVIITQFEAEADVFSDTTIIKVEINDRKTTFETTADTREEVIAEIVARFSVDRATVDRVLDFEIEDRASRVKDLSTSVSSDDDRVRTSVTLFEELTGSLSDDDQSRFVEELLRSFNSSSARVEVQHDNDGDSRIEIRDGETRIRIEEKDGEVEVRVREDDDSRSSEDDDSSDDSRSSSGSFLEAEADVFSDTTIIKVEINDRKTTFETTADTREEVIAEIVARFSVDRATVDRVLDFEIEDRASRTKDSDDDSDNLSSNSNNGSDDDSDSSSDDSGDSPDDSDGRVKIEVRVEDGIAEVRMEYAGKREEFETAYTNKSALVVLLASRSKLSESTISSALDLEIKD